MGSVSNSLSSTLSSISNPVSVEGSTSTGGIFTGTSEFSSELQSEITREVDIADLPIDTLQNQVTTLQNQSSAMTTLNTDFTSLQTAVQGIASALDGSSYSADVSDPDVVSATLGTGATQGVYNIDVENVGSYQTSLSTNTWDSSGSTPNTYTLVVGNQSYQFTPTDNSADSVVAAINSQFGNLVQATAVNVGSASSPDERISLQSTTLGPTTVDLQLNGQSLQTQQQPPGSQAEYMVNDSGENVYSDSDTVTISDGISLDLQGTGSASITVSQPISTLSNALSSFVTAYNQCATDLTAQRGQSGGALQGQAIVNELQEALNSIAGYFNTADPGAAVNSLSSLGVTMSDTGQMSFDELGFASTALTSSAAVNSFLGSATGGGFLDTATNALNNMLDSSSGFLTTEQSNDQTQITNLQSEISTDQANVSTLQSNLQDQLSQSDASIAELEQQYSSLSEMFSAEQTEDEQIANGV
jgi:flagellar hook-associated protein 2